jgi:hypothetical protein
MIVMEDKVSTVLAESARLRSLGRHEETLLKLASLPILGLSPQEKRLLASEKFEVYYGRGYFYQAEKVMRKAVAMSSKELCQRKSEEELWTHVLLRAKKALVLIVTKARIKYALQVRMELTGVFLDNVDNQSKMNDSLVCSM